MVINRIMEPFASFSYEELVNFSRQEIDYIVPFFEKCEIDCPSKDALFAIVCAAMSSDGVFSEPEYRYFCDCFKISESFDSVEDVVRSYSSENILTAVDSLLNNITLDVKIHVVALCCCALSIDKTITKTESVFLKRLLGIL